MTTAPRPIEAPHQSQPTPASERFHREVMRRAAAIEGITLAYGEDPHQSVLLFPARRPLGPVLVGYHGGVWSNGFKEWLSFMAPALTARGITFASVGYRLAPACHFPDGWEDCLHGFDLVYRSIAAHGANPNAMYLMGHGAGAHYATLAALKTGWRDALSLPGDVVKGCLPISGTYNFGAGSGLAQRPEFLGPPEHKGERFASAIRYAYDRAPPFLVTYGSNDLPHVISQSAALVAALRREGARAEELALPGADHFSASLSAVEETGPWLAAALWLMGLAGG